MGAAALLKNATPSKLQNYKQIFQNFLNHEFQICRPDGLKVMLKRLYQIMEKASFNGNNTTKK